MAGALAGRHGGEGRNCLGHGREAGTTLYLCLEDSTLRIQNRLFEITEDAPANVHFSTNSDTLVRGWRNSSARSSRSIPTRC